MKPTSKRKRVSKNKKKNWRKYSNITDVEEFLEEKRVEERTGGPASEKKDEHLFYVDKTQKTIKKKRKTKGKSIKTLKCYQFLENTSQVEPFIKPCRVKTPEEKRTPLVLKRQLLKEAKKFSSSPQIAEPQDSCEYVPFRLPQYNLWETGEHKMQSDYELDIDKHKKQAFDLKVPKFRYEKPSDLPSVEVPHPGASYNPPLVEHQKLLNEAHEIELKKKKESDHLERVLTQKFPTKDEAPTPETWFKEMSRCLQIEGAEEGEQTDAEEELSDENLLSNAPVRAERKPRAKRRKEVKQKLLLKEIEKKKQLKKQLNEIYKIKSIKSAIREKEEKTRRKIEKRKRKEKAKRKMPGKLSRNRYEAPDLEVCTTDELTKNLRGIKIQGCLAEDRIKSFQRRNVLEPCIRQFRKSKYKRKRYVKKSHRE